MSVEPRPAIEPRPSIQPAEPVQSSVGIDPQLQKEIESKLIQQFQLWDQEELLPKGVDVSGLTGNNISPAIIHIAFGKQAHDDIFGASRSHKDRELGPVVLSVGSVVDGALNTKRGGSNVAQGSSDSKRSPEGIVVNPAAQNAVHKLALLFSRAVKAKQENNTLRVPAQHEQTPGLVSANSVADLVNGLNAVLDESLQIDTSLLRGLA